MERGADVIIVEVYSPAVDAGYDFQIHEDMSAAEAAREVSVMIARKNGTEISDVKDSDPYADASLYDTERKVELNKALSLKENGVTSGRRLLLI